VYIKYNCNHVIKKTIIRRLSGDMDKFTEELRKVVSNAEVRRKVGKIEIAGVHKESVETWLLRLGL
jgi:chaperonin cofactor prefoldin